MTITIYDGFAAIGMLATGWFIVAVYLSSKQHYREAERFDYKNQPDDLPKWDKLNTVGKFANKELKKMYRGNVKLYNNPYNEK